MSGRRCFLKALLELSAYLSTKYSNYILENFLVKRASRLRKRQQKHLTQRIAVFGASFNPTTLGHVDFIRCLLQSSVPSFERVCLIPSGQSPLKTAAEYASARNRLQILDLVLQTQFTSLERARLRVETTEVTRQSPSWMVMTLTSLILRHRAQESYTLACGYDHLLQMHKWYRWSDLASLCDVCFYPRTQVDILNRIAAEACVALCRGKIKVTVIFIHTAQKEEFFTLCAQGKGERDLKKLAQYLTLTCDPMANIRASSASDIRAFYHNTEPNQTNVPEGIGSEVHHYIIAHDCYLNNSASITPKKKSNTKPANR